MLVQEGAARAHRKLAPLLALHTRPLELQKALATMYLTLQVGCPPKHPMLLDGSMPVGGYGGGMQILVGGGHFTID